MNTIENLDRRAAIICSHIANDRLPILRAVRHEPTMAEDSGWQFVCGVAEEDPDEAKVWLIYEVLGLDHTLKEIIDLPAGATASRHTASTAWNITEESGKP